MEDNEDGEEVRAFSSSSIVTVAVVAVAVEVVTARMEGWLVGRTI